MQADSRYMRRIIGQDYEGSDLRAQEQYSMEVIICMILNNETPDPRVWDCVDLTNAARFEGCQELDVRQYDFEQGRRYIIASLNCSWKIMLHEPLHVAYILRCVRDMNMRSESVSVPTVARYLLKYLIPFRMITPFDNTKHSSKPSMWTGQQWKLDDQTWIGLGRRSMTYKSTQEDRSLAE